ncbi:serine O-acetyltransferase EpsC [Dubosiella newyorkensis]|jgi:serine O-acetyltransferase|uniref:Serine acetyltransferase n=2 Tax=Dubosiella newyorkensis TaxID=1862672 RepID=A0A1U7NJS1_9FIRM|nr:serine O-acetyltransferase EpsC [Dubosiella newyorkensis]MCI9041695.1 serine acetyltransferase [Dubosiella newyorkensis]OLU44009.1 hypothetical protein BO225_11170 [Dubosiella newyorkensis]
MGFIQFVKGQIKTIKRLDPSLHSTVEIFFMPGFKALNTHYFTHKLYPKHPALARILSLRAQRKTGIDIHPGAVIGKDVFIDHGSGVVIGETCVIHDRVMIYQGVTLGATGKVSGKRHPTVEEDVVIGAGSKVIGNIVLHKGCKIGAGSIIIKSVEPYTTMIPSPAYPVREQKEINNALAQLRNEHKELGH